MKNFVIAILAICLAAILLLTLTDYRIFECHLCGRTQFGSKNRYNLLGTELTICDNCMNHSEEIVNDAANQFLSDMQKDLYDMFK